MAAARRDERAAAATPRRERFERGRRDATASDVVQHDQVEVGETSGPCRRGRPAPSARRPFPAGRARARRPAARARSRRARAPVA
jgi:hypothetical protein